jgi:hypothetical protein
MPVPLERTDDAWFEPLSRLALAPETELYLGLIHPEDGAAGARERIAAARRHVQGFGAATECGWGREGAAAVDGLLDLHREVTEPLPVAGERASAAFAWPHGFEPIPDADWTTREVDEAGIAYDNVEAHGWYDNLDSTVEELATDLRDGDVLLDYSGGTGICSTACGCGSSTARSAR